MASTEDTEEPIYLGINISGGVAYLGAASGSGALLLDDPVGHVGANLELDPPERLEDLRARLAQELRRLAHRAVGVARTRKYQQWAFQDAFDRFTLEAAAMLAAVQEDFPCRHVKGEDSAAAVGVPAKELPEHMPGALGIERTSHWKHRSVAFATALALAREADS